MNKYEEALERARKVRDSIIASHNLESAKLYTGHIENIFPELRESEDKRVTRAINNMLPFIPDEAYANNGVTKEDVLNWLEKLKEQKVDIDKLRKDIYQSGYNDGYQHGREDEQKTPDPGLVYKKGYQEGYQLGYEKGYDEGQKVQKPAECLKAERDGWYVCIKDYYRGGRKRSSVGDLVQAKGGMHIMGEKDISEWFRRAYYEEVRDAFEPNADTNIPVKPAEWSEEDEQMVQFWNMYYEHEVGDWPNKDVVEHLERFKEWLNNRFKSLRPEQKDVLPSLSEKEIICLKRALDYLRKEHNRYGGEDFTNEIAVLEWLITHPVLVYSSQPHWKPSEEQMEALRIILEHEAERIGSSEELSLANSLYEQLKKLM